MAEAALWESTREAEDSRTYLDEWIERELAEIVQEAERDAETKEPGVACWFYRVPFSGVRYYSDREWPSSVKPGIRRARPVELAVSGQ